MPTTVHLPAKTAVVLPGTGSDEVFIAAAFAAPLNAAGVQLQAPAPQPGPALVDGYCAALDAAAEAAGAEKVLVGGVSLGAHVAVQWALRNPARCAGVLAALPAYTGAAAGAPAAQASRASAALVRDHGLERALQLATAGVPGWLADELVRSWRGHGGGLAAGLEAASGHPAPTAAQLRRLAVPVGVVGVAGDPLHPLAVARAWARDIPRAGLAEITFRRLGADPAAIGRAAVEALRAGVGLAPMRPS